MGQIGFETNPPGRMWKAHFLASQEKASPKALRRERLREREGEERRGEEMVLRNLVQLKSIVKEAIDRTVIVAKFLCFLHVTNTYICSPALVYGPSMLPTFNLTGDLVISERISTRLGKVKHGDIVLVLSPENPKKIVTKRIVGMEGDKVTYLVDPKNTEISNTVTVPKGHVWIQGDNMYASKDSRHFGAVPYGLLQGKVFCRIWPLGGFGSLGQRV